MKGLIVFVLFILPELASSQAPKPYPVIGERLPSFTLSDVHYFSESSVSGDAFKGKYLILDFWTVGCSVCIESFPKVNALQQKFREDVQFLLVGKADHGVNKNVRQLYERIRTIKKLDLAVAYDSALFDQFGIQTTPHVVIADPNGTVLAVTSHLEITAGNLGLLIAGKTPQFRRVYSTLEAPSGRITYDSVFLGALSNKSKDGFFYKSVLTAWKVEMPVEINTSIEGEYKGEYRSTCMSLARLYTLAYTGRAMWRYGDSLYTVFTPHPILEVSDASPFADDFNKGKGLFNYYVAIPKERATKKEMMRVMRCDLEKYFGYRVRVETRTVPCLKLKATPDAKTKLISWGGNTNTNKVDHLGFSLYNVPVDEVLSIVYGYHDDRLYMDETGFGDRKIDIRINALLTDFADIERAFREQGLYFVAGVRKMQVLVISDPAENSGSSTP